jgi:hypothetical protein
MSATRIVTAQGAFTNPLPNITPPANSKPAYVLYIRVIYSLQSDGTLASSYSYDPISGFYPLDSGIGAFINKIRTNTVFIDDQLDPIPDNAVPVVEDPCYVVFSIPPNATVSFAANAITTDDTTPNEYFNLKTATNPSAPVGPFIAYFRAISPSEKGADTAGDDDDAFNDHFTLNFTVGSGTGMLDPAIKNTGHTGG